MKDEKKYKQKRGTYGKKKNLKGEGTKK